MKTTNRKRRQYRNKIKKIAKKDDLDYMEAALLHKQRAKNKLPKDQRINFGPSAKIVKRDDLPQDNGKPFNLFKKTPAEKNALKRVKSKKFSTDKFFNKTVKKTSVPEESEKS